MHKQKNPSWSRLDNAAKIFPSSTESTDTRVFRFTCQLTEPVVPELLQKAVDAASESFPQFLTVMRRGMFWYYLEQTDLRPVVTEENRSPCAPLYLSGRRTLLFRVSYYRRRINLELYHALSDGTGALEFLKAILAGYLQLRHPELSSTELGLVSASASDKEADSFQKYYQKIKGEKRAKAVRAYRLKGEKRDEENLQLIEAMVSVRSVLDAAHRHKTTLTVFLTALYIQAIRQEMYLRDRKKPVVIRVPVNLRTYFPSETARNFFGMIEVRYDVGSRSGELEDIIRAVDETFRRELQRDRLAVRMNRLADLEHNPLIQIVPLPLKNIVLRHVRHMNDKGETAVISNIGRIVLPEAMVPYVESFHVFASTLKTQLCVCSFGDRLQLGFSTAYSDTGLERNFVRLLIEQGIEAEINASETAEELGPPDPPVREKREAKKAKTKEAKKKARDKKSRRQRKEE